MNAQIVLLALSQAALMTIISLVLASSALIGARLSSTEFATVPLALQYLATMLMLLPIARLMERFGRRPVFGAGALIGAVGLALAAAGLHSGSFVLFAAAGLLIGSFNAVGQYYRFAAADAVAPQHRGTAIALTLSGGLLAALAGPALAKLTKDALAPPFLASFMVLVAIAVLGALFAAALRLPPAPARSAAPALRPWREIARNRRLVVAVLGSVAGYAVMNLLMTATPLAMQAAGLGFGEVATVIQWHLVAMFAPSFVTGALIARIGVTKVMLAGCALNLASIGISWTGSESSHFLVGLILLGAGWNFLYVGGTALLVESCRPQEALRIQAVNDTLVFSAVAAATFLSGVLVDALGWKTLNLYATLPIAAVVLALLSLALDRRKGAATGAPGSPG